jgi:integrase/recombinase XerD
MQCSRQGGFLAPKTIQNEFATLFEWLRGNNLARDNVMAKPKRPRRVVYDAPRHLTVEEYLRLKAQIKNQKLSDYVDFYLLTGIRRADGLRVTSENFDFEQMIATLPQQKQGNTKQLPISADLNDVVMRMIQRVGNGNPLVQLHVSRLTGYFAHARDKAGLPRSITFHSLRHTFFSWLAAAGVDLKSIQELSGHKSLKSTDIYLHPHNPNKRSAVEKLVLPRAGARWFHQPG